MNTGTGGQIFCLGLLLVLGHVCVLLEATQPLYGASWDICSEAKLYLKRRGLLSLCGTSNSGSSSPSAGDWETRKLTQNSVKQLSGHDEGGRRRLLINDQVGATWNTATSYTNLAENTDFEVWGMYHILSDSSFSYPFPPPRVPLLILLKSN